MPIQSIHYIFALTRANHRTEFFYNQEMPAIDTFYHTLISRHFEIE